MRFKAMVDFKALRTLTNVAQSFEKVSETCVLNLTPEAFEMRRKPDAESEIQIYASFSADGEFFCDYQIQSKAENRISIVVRVKTLLRGLRSAGQAAETTFKLCKRNSIHGNASSTGIPCFSIIAETLNGILVTQDVPILQMLSKEGMEDYREPVFRHELLLEFPEPLQVRSVLESMRTMDDFFSLQMSPKGELVIRVENEMVTVRKIFRDLVVVKSPETDGDGPEEEGTVIETRLNVREVLSVLNFGATKFEKVIICAGPELPMAIYGSFEGDVGCVTYYCPIAQEETY